MPVARVRLTGHKGHPSYPGSSGARKMRSSERRESGLTPMAQAARDRMVKATP